MTGAHMINTLVQTGIAAWVLWLVGVAVLQAMVSRRSARAGEVVHGEENPVGGAGRDRSGNLWIVCSVLTLLMSVLACFVVPRLLSGAAAQPSWAVLALNAVPLLCVVFVLSRLTPRVRGSAPHAALARARIAAVSIMGVCAVYTSVVLVGVVSTTRGAQEGGLTALMSLGASALAGALIAAPIAGLGVLPGLVLAVASVGQNARRSDSRIVGAACTRR